MAHDVRHFERLRNLLTAPRQMRIWKCLLGALLAALLACAAFFVHLNLSSAGSLELLLIILIALRWGFTEATAASLVAAAGLNFLFIPPIFQFTIDDPANWISLLTFEATSLLVSRLSTKVQLHAIDAEAQRQSATKLYELSRAILLIDSRVPTHRQLATLIQEIFHVPQVEISLADDRSLLAHSTPELFTRILRVGETAIGTMRLIGWQSDPLVADAIASLSAIAIERARAIQQESRAESERDTEKLRTAVLDGLAHSFKTPLTAIQTASSGLLAIGHGTPTQTELISIIDEQATLLNRLTTRLLQTASLDGRRVKLRKVEQSFTDVVGQVVATQGQGAANLITLHMEPQEIQGRFDAELIEMALTQLLDNALKYSDVGKPVLVSVTASEGEATVLVENDGIPIRPEETDRVFERFYRGSNAVHGPSGTGLGLSVVRKVADAHHGRVVLKADGNRTQFALTIPL